jgi:hypothetical protein
MNPGNIPEVSAILEQAGKYSRARHTEVTDEADARRRLNAHGLSDGEIARQLATLKRNTANTAAVLTTYSFLHSLHHLDDILAKSPERSYSADAIIALFRCAEVCLYNIAIHSSRMKANIETGQLSLAASNARWRAGFHESLYRLSSLIAEVSGDSDAGDFLDIRDSRIYRIYQERGAELESLLLTDWVESDSAIFEKDLDDPQRFVFFSEFVNTSDARVWLSRLSRVRLPGSMRDAGEDDKSFYAKTVCTDDIEAMMLALDTEADTDLLSFRAIHQVSEIIASCINPHLCSAIAALVSPDDGGTDEALRALVFSNRLLSVADDTIKLMMRALTPRAYRHIRPNLGMVRGTSSIVLRKTLFNATYPLFVYAFRLKISGYSSGIADSDDSVFDVACELMKSGDTRLVGIMQQLTLFHQHVRAWRDNHQQLPKTHLGMSVIPGKPTVSLSGSSSGVDIAHELRKTHASDPIIPLYKALLGTAPPDVHDLITPGGFDEHMAHATARAVHEVYAVVQERFYERRAKKGAG